LVSVSVSESFWIFFLIFFFGFGFGGILFDNYIHLIRRTRLDSVQRKLF
jgi:hypothetical protein